MHFYSCCSECECDPVGTMSNKTCLTFGGFCASCHPGVTGARCDNCMNGWFNFTAGGCQGEIIYNYACMHATNVHIIMLKCSLHM